MTSAQKKFYKNNPHLLPPSVAKAPTFFSSWATALAAEAEALITPVSQSKKAMVMDKVYAAMTGRGKTVVMPDTATSSGLPSGEGPETWYLCYTDENRGFIRDWLYGWMKDSNMNMNIYEDTQFHGKKAFILPCADEAEFEGMTRSFKEWCSPVIDALQKRFPGRFDMRFV
jgi:hypothetical protein